MGELFESILAARDRLRGHAHRTPVVTSRTLDELAGARVFLKCENLQRVGAFKFRGAYNAISLLPEAAKAAGVIAYSSGNHAQGIALAARLLGVGATIVMPANAPATKRAATEGYGAAVVVYEPGREDREAVAERLRRETGATLIPPFDHRDVIAGQGTAALELLEEVGALDLLLVPCGGGGLLSGSAIAARGISPGCRVFGVEPEQADDATRSFRTRTLQRIENPRTIADGARTPSLGAITFPLVLEYAAGMCTVSEAAIADAVRFLFFRLKLVVEPSGALPVAALLTRAVEPEGPPSQAARRIGVVLSGGNIDGPTMTALLSS